MKLFIQIKNGQPFEHPILEENFYQAFPNINPNNLPQEFANFERIKPPIIGVYEICETKYEWIGNIVKDVHYVRSMTEQEKTDKKQKIKEEWAKEGFSSWKFNEETCSFIPPISYPIDNKNYRWDENLKNWVQI